MEIIYWIKNRTVSEFSIIRVPEIKGLEYQETQETQDNENIDLTWIFDSFSLDKLTENKLDSITNKINNPITKSIIKCFDINDYRKRGGGETKDRIHRTIESFESLRDRREGIKNTLLC